MFKRVAIVNRGEAARRLIHAVRELNAERVAASELPSLQTIALHTESERNAPFVREADFGYCLGPAADRPYLNLAVLERALTESGADAAWVGWGFVAEDPAFVELCDRLGITFIGPAATVMRQLGDKIEAKLLAEEAGVPVAPWSRRPLRTLEEALSQAQRIGYPLMLKATAGGGGRGIRAVRSDEELREAYQRTSEEASRAFGSGIIFAEKLVAGARHVEVQVIADSHGTAWALGVRDCSIQRRNQKVIEESASPLLSPEQVLKLKESAERLVVAADYCGACTVEFLYHPADRFFAFLEVNTRLQVEHPVTEATTGIDLVKAQLHVAAGGCLTGERPMERGHAVEARLNAEDPDHDFAPAPGRVELLRWPVGPGIRIDTGVTEGDVIPPDFDSMVAKIIAFGRNRDEAMARLRRAVAETTVIIDGGTTNKSFLTALLAAPEVVKATADTAWVDRARAAGQLKAHQHLGITLAGAAIDSYEQAENTELSRLRESGRSGRPHVQHKPGQIIEFVVNDHPFRVSVARTDAYNYQVRIENAAGEDVAFDATRERLSGHFSRLTVNGRAYQLASAIHGPMHVVEVDGVTYRVSRDQGGVLTAPAPALVVAAPVAVGTEVRADSPVLVLESMKMETVLRAPFDARVRELLVSVGSQVGSGTALVRLEPIGDDISPSNLHPPVTPIDLMIPQQAEPCAADRALATLARLRGLVLGFDPVEESLPDTIAGYLRDRDAAIASGAPVRVTERALVAAFTDVSEVSSPQPSAGSHRSPREQFHTYLQTLDIERTGGSGDFRRALERALHHYGVTELAPTPALEQGVFRIFLAQERYDAGVQAMRALLTAWVGDPAPAAARSLIERLVQTLQARAPLVADIARRVAFRWFHQPEAEAARAAALAGVREELQALADLPYGLERKRRIANLVEIPQPLDGFLAERISSEWSPREPMLEVSARWHYGLQDMRSLRTLHVSGRPFVVCDYNLAIQPNRSSETTAVITVGRFQELIAGGRLPGDLRAQLATAPIGHVRVADLYLTWPGAPATAEEQSAALHAALVASGIANEVRRVVVGVANRNEELPSIEYFTFRRRMATGAGEFEEDTLVRGVHPLVGRRLHLWRLQNFHVTRVLESAGAPTPHGVLLYHCVAKNNPDDQRLMALAQVHRFEVSRDADGQVTEIEGMGTVLAACVDAIGQARHDLDPAAKWLDMNHVWLDIRPVSDVAPEDLAEWQRATAPQVAQAGIEEILVQGQLADPDGRLGYVVTRLSYEPGETIAVSVEEPPTQPLAPLDDYQQKVLQARRRGTVHPYELVELLAGPHGEFTELELEGAGLRPTDRPRGHNTAGIITGIVSTPTPLYPDGIRRIVLFGDPTKALGALAEPECARVIAALDFAEREGIPVEWFAVSAGALISMKSGTENMDAIARALRRIVGFTQSGGEINIVVTGINVGAQPYWNAEATMLMHTRGILVMIPASAMVLTGKQALDFSGGVSAEDNFGIGGYARVMGPNGQAQYWASDLAGARDVLMSHYDHTYIACGETVPRRAVTSDPTSRDITSYPISEADTDFGTVGEIFSATANPDRKKPFEISDVMRAVGDQDHPLLERWPDMSEAETAIVTDARIGGWPVCLIGIQSRPVARRGFPPADGPASFTAGTLFPQSSKKIARAINAASGNRPVVVLANLSGFDGSPESMRRLQLEYGAEIGRAIVNFDGKIVFCLISRYHGGAYVVFSKSLNDNMTVLAVEGSFASVIGGAPAAAVVFSRQVDAQTTSDPRVAELEARLAGATEAEKKAELAGELAEVRDSVRAEMLAAVASEFDAIHSIHRAVKVGSVDAVIPARDLRPAIAEQVAAWNMSSQP